MVVRQGDDRSRIWGKFLDDGDPVMSESYFTRLFNGYVPDRLEGVGGKIVRLCRAFPDDALAIMNAWLEDQSDQDRADAARALQAAGRSFPTPEEPAPAPDPHVAEIIEMLAPFAGVDRERVMASVRAHLAALPFLPPGVSKDDVEAIFEQDQARLTIAKNYREKRKRKTRELKKKHGPTIVDGEKKKETA